MCPGCAAAVHRTRRVPFRVLGVSRPGLALMGGLTSSTNCLEVSSKHTTGRSGSSVVQVQHILHPGHELPAQLGDAPLFLLPGLSSWFEFVFLSIWRTVSREMLPANSSATTWSASSWSVQCACPSALLQVMATRCAPPLSLRPRPGRGRSLIAASARTPLATVAALSETASAAARSGVSALALPCGLTACQPDVSIRAERSDWVSSTLYLEQACQVRPH